MEGSTLDRRDWEEEANAQDFQDTSPGHCQVSDIMLMVIVGEVVRDLDRHSAAIEECLRNPIEDPIESFLVAKLLTSERAMSEKQPGRIDKLSEYSTVLIPAAVTRKIDVRKEVPCPH